MSLPVAAVRHSGVGHHLRGGGRPRALQCAGPPTLGARRPSYHNQCGFAFLKNEYFSFSKCSKCRHVLGSCTKASHTNTREPCRNLFRPGLASRHSRIRSQVANRHARQHRTLHPFALLITAPAPTPRPSWAAAGSTGPLRGLGSRSRPRPRQRQPRRR